ncbi:MAG: MerR family transcriptional regulator [Deltaproteobacteria bacterium]|nr:MerR family transcriptional regulator [Deltaproteobacteria bacterium]
MSIQQVSLELRIPKPTLRFWEREFEGILLPLRTQGGQRRYTSEHVSIIKGIKELRGKGMPLAEIKKELNNRDQASRTHLNPSRIDSLANRLAEVVSDEVYSFFQREGLK